MDDTIVELDGHRRRRAEPRRERHEPLIGRSEDLRRLETALEGRRLVSVIGPPGVGKSALVGAYLEQAARERAAYVDLSATPDLDGVLAEVAQTLGLEFEPGGAGDGRVEQIGRAMARLGKLVLVVDNAERHTDASAGVIHQWLELAPELRVLVASRQPMGVDSEVRLELAPLEVPAPDAEAALEAASVRLFVERARRIQSDFEGTPQNQGAIVDLVRLLEGLPLAIELAARWISLLSVEQFVEQVESTLEKLSCTGGQARFATLSDAIGWSWQMLTPPQRSGLMQCSVFAGSFDISTAEAVLEIDDASTLDVLLALREHSLLQVASGADRSMTLLRPIREFARARLEEQGQYSAVRQRLLCHMAREARQCQLEAEQLGRLDALRRLESLQEQLRVLIWGVELDQLPSEQLAAVVDCANGVAYLAWRTGQFVGLSSLLEELLSAAEEAGLAARRVELLWSLARFDGLANRMSLTIERLERAVELSHEVDNERTMLWSAIRCAFELSWGAELDRAYQRLEQLDAREQMPDWARGWIHYVRANLLDLESKQAAASHEFQRAFEWAQREGNGSLRARSLLGLVRLHQAPNLVGGDLSDELEEFVASRSPWVSLPNFANLHLSLGVRSYTSGDYGAALEYNAQAIELYGRCQMRCSIGLAMANQAWCHLAVGESSEAAHHARRAADVVVEAQHGSEFTRSSAVFVILRLLWKLDEEDQAIQLLEGCEMTAPRTTASPLWNASVALYASLLAATDRPSSAEDVLRAFASQSDIRVEPFLLSLAETHLRITRRRHADDGGDRGAIDILGPMGAWPEQLASASASFSESTLEELVEFTLRRLPTHEAAMVRLQLGEGAATRLLVAQAQKQVRAPRHDWADISSSQIRWQLFELLLDRRLAAPGDVVTVDELAEHLWPDEVLTPSSLKNRLYVNVSKLRQAGLEEVLLRGEDGYLLDPDVPVERERPSTL